MKLAPGDAATEIVNSNRIYVALDSTGHELQRWAIGECGDGHSRTFVVQDANLVDL